MSMRRVLSTISMAALIGAGMAVVGHGRQDQRQVSAGAATRDTQPFGVDLKALGMVVSTDVDFNGGPAVMNGFSQRWQSIFGGGAGEFAVDGEDESYSGVHARSAIGGFTGRFSIEPEIIVAIPPELAKAIIQNRGWVFPLPPAVLETVKAARN